ncbi:uncharacterized protein LOC125670140 [Ostrea edulis]|uniref:uncharacterized protein LOC125670140 n=1 Tax=Ostrea edulis TaxID=37623 RepID=UPI0024AEE03B|nr:uncharacterized protein LOC125670140 [Ostrea edulis]
MALDATGSSLTFLLLFAVFLPAEVSCSCDTVNLQPHLIKVKETDQGVTIKNITYSLPDVTWSMALSIADTMATAQLGEYIKLNFDNTSLELEVVKALDKEELYSKFKVDIESITLQMSCSTSGSLATRTNLTLVITALNEFSPEIHGGPYDVSVREDTSIGSTVLMVNVTDPDVPKTPLLYTTKATGSMGMGSEYFGFPQPNNPGMKLLKGVDYDMLVSNGKEPIFHFLLNVTDENGYGLRSQTNITVVIEDVDDLPPLFLYPECGKHCATTQYRIITEKAHRGPLTVHPVSLKAKDQDSLNYSIIYSIRPDQKNYQLSFEIDGRSGIISQVRDVNRTGILSVKAEENSTNKHYAVALVLIEFPETPVNQPEPNTAEHNKNGLLIGLIVLAIAAAALLYFVVFLVLLHKRLKKQVTPLEVDDKTTKELKLKVPKTSEVNEVKPIPRESGIREEGGNGVENSTEHSDYEKNALGIYNSPTPSKRNNLLEPIKSRESQKKRKKKRKKKTDVLKRLGHEKQQQSDNTEIQHRNDDEHTENKHRNDDEHTENKHPNEDEHTENKHRNDDGHKENKHRNDDEHTENKHRNVKDTNEMTEGDNPHQVQALVGHFVDENTEIMV